MTQYPDFDVENLSSIERLKNSIILPFCFFRPELKVLTDQFVRDDRIHLIDSEGRVHHYALIEVDE